MIALYRRYNPAAVGGVAKIMSQYSGAEIYAYHALCFKYNATPMLPIPADIHEWVDIVPMPNNEMNAKTEPQYVVIGWALKFI